MTIRQACDFIYKMHNLLWRDNEVFPFFESIWLYDYPRLIFHKNDSERYMHFYRTYINDDSYSVKHMIRYNDSKTKHIAISTVDWFFGPATKEKFKREKYMRDAFNISPV